MKPVPSGSNPIVAKLEHPNGGLYTTQDEIVVSGWIVAPGGVRIVAVLVDGRRVGRAVMSEYRADVDRALEVDDCLACGFRYPLQLAPYRGRTIELAVEIAGVHEHVRSLGPVRITVARCSRPHFTELLKHRLRNPPGPAAPHRGWRLVLQGVRGALTDYRQFLETGRLEPMHPPADLPPCQRQPLAPLSAHDRAMLERRLASLPYAPSISVIVPCTEADGHRLQRTLDSLRDQIYAKWEAIVAPVRSVDPSPIAAAHPWDNRVRMLAAGNYRNPAEAINHALDTATGEFVGIVYPGDLLTPDAMLHVASTLAVYPMADFLYSDEDKLDEHDKLYDAFHKPSWSPELLLCQHYTGQWSVYRRALLLKLGGLRADRCAAWEHDLALRVSEEASEIVRVPRVLYHRLATGAATTLNAPADACAAAIRDVLARRRTDAVVRPTNTPGIYSVRLRPRGHPRVSIIIPTRDRAALVRQCVGSILRRTAYPHYEILVINNGSTATDALALFRSWSGEEKVRVLDDAGPFNYSALNNRAVQHCRSPFILLLNNDTQVISRHWLDAMLGLAQQPGVGAVGAKLYFWNDTVQHAGCVVGMGNKPAAHAHKFFPRGHPGYFGHLHATRNVSVVTAACLMTPRDVYLQVGGLDERLAVAYNDVDFCLRLRQRGYRIVWTPEAELYHFESATRDIDQRGEPRYEQEIQYMSEKWPELPEDPYFNPNLSLNASNYAARDAA